MNFGLRNISANKMFIFSCPYLPTSESWCWTGKPGVLQSVELQRVGHDWETELNWFTNLDGFWWKVMDPGWEKPDNGCSNYNWCLINSHKPGTLLTAFQALFYLVHPTTQCKRCYYCPILQMKTLRFGCQELAHKLAHLACQVALMVKNPPANAGDSKEVGSIPESGRFPGGGNGNPL